MATHHINGERGDFAKVVLMPGDPLRAKWIAETFLHDTKLVTEIRGILGYTGYTKNGKRISVMASGMGMPSIGIYSMELFTSFDVDLIVRVGTCGSYRRDVHVGDVILAQGSCCSQNYVGNHSLHGGVFSALASYDVLKTFEETSVALNKNVHVGNILASDVFYEPDEELWKIWSKFGVLGVEMESYALYCNAATNNKKAMAMFTVSDSMCGEADMPASQRQQGLVDMIEIAIAAAEKYC